MNGVGTTDKNKTQQNKIQHNSHKKNYKNKLNQTQFFFSLQQTGLLSFPQ